MTRWLTLYSPLLDVGGYTLDMRPLDDHLKVLALLDDLAKLPWFTEDHRLAIIRIYNDNMEERL